MRHYFYVVRQTHYSSVSLFERQKPLYAVGVSATIRVRHFYVVGADFDDALNDDNPSNISVENQNRGKRSDEKRKRARTAIQEGVLNQLIYALSAGLGVVTNTLFVAIFTLVFFNGTSIAQTVVTVEYVLAWFGVNFAVELVSFSLITPPIVLAIRSARLA